MEISKIIHQIWSGIDEPLPSYYKVLGETWKGDYPTWQYEFWDNKKMNNFIRSNYPQYWDSYNCLPYNIQRWDVIRYMILYKIGGMYVDFDYESIRPMDNIIENARCCFALEPAYQYKYFNKSIMFNNALMLSVPGHSFMKKIIDRSLSKESIKYPIHTKNECVLNSTGPFMLIDLYENLSVQERQDIYMIPAKYVTPFDGYQAQQFRKGVINNQLEDCLREAYAVHYFFGDWRL